MVARVERHAILINGDMLSDRADIHRQNIKTVGKFLRNQGYTLWILEGSEVTRSKLSRILSGLQNRMDGDDELFIYATGHGARSNSSKSLTLQFIDSETKALNYGERAVWIDHCYGGGGFEFFAKDSRTLFVSAGSKDETVNCQLFTPVAFDGDVRDLNKDGTITFWERFVAGAWSVASKAVHEPIYYAGERYEDNGTSRWKVSPHFTTDVVEVSTNKALGDQLSRLQPGQYAFVDFSASWCKPCKLYDPKFKALALQSKGRYLFIKAEGVNSRRYGVTDLPEVKIFRDRDKVGYPVENRENPVKSIPLALLNDKATIQVKIDRLLEKLKSPNWHQRSRAVVALCRIGKPAMAALIQAMGNDDIGVRWAAVAGLTKMGDAVVPEIVKALDSPNSGMRDSAAMILGDRGKPVPNAVPILMRLMLEDPDESVRRHAAEALGKIGEPKDEIKKALLKAQGDPNKWVRRNAAEAFRKIEGT